MDNHIPINFFAKEIALIDAKTKQFLEKFENEGLEKLIEKWGGYYFGRQNEIQNADEFKNKLRGHIEECIRYLITEREKNDWDEIHKIHWIEETYKELLHDDGQNTPKQEAIVEQVGAKGKVLQILDWIRRK